MFRKVAPWYSKRFGPANEFNKRVVQVSSRAEFHEVLQNYIRWREQFLDENGNLKPRFQPGPMVASFMQEPAVAQRERIPVPTGPVAWTVVPSTAASVAADEPANCGAGESFLAYPKGFGNFLRLFDAGADGGAAKIVSDEMQAGDIFQVRANCREARGVAEIILRDRFFVSRNAGCGRARL